MTIDQLESHQKAEELISWIRQYATTRINSRVMDERRTIAPNIILDLGNKGILGMQVPKRYGGLALSTVDLMRVIQQLTAIDMTLGTFVGLNNWLGIWPIQMYASEEVKQELLPRLAWGRELAAFAFTEPGAGSDARSIRTFAVPAGPQQQAISGEKSWIGSGAWAGVTTVFVQQLDDQQRPSGISGYVLKADTEGVSQGPEALTMGMRAMIQNTVKFNAARVEEKYLLGNKNVGMDIAQDIMMHARLGIAGLSLGGMKRCAQLMLRYARRRRISTGLLLLLNNDKTTLYSVAARRMILSCVGATPPGPSGSLKLNVSGAPPVAGVNSSVMVVISSSSLPSPILSFWQPARLNKTAIKLI
ncbi:MAG: acyl-CoA dehydrogenase [Cytophagaceae bacterium]|nr:MAG: acyl-CoA dehydrogenase [Cytophagaceae bacterium]